MTGPRIAAVVFVAAFLGVGYVPHGSPIYWLLAFTILAGVVAIALGILTPRRR